MGTLTTNYSLFKPDGTDFISASADLNVNWDAVDAALTAHDARLATQETYWYTTGPSGTQTLTTTSLVDLTGVSVSVPVAGTSDTYKVTASVDLQNNNSDAVLGYINLDVAGTPISSQGIWEPKTAQARATITYFWVVSGFTAGTKTFKIRGSLSAAGSFDYRTDYSKILVERTV